mgnify:CR=1 FL=1
MLFRSFFSLIRSARICSMELASTIIKTYANERLQSSKILEDLPCLRSVLASVHIFSGLLSRGLNPIVSGQKFMQISFEVEEPAVAKDFDDGLFGAVMTTAKEATPLPGNLLLQSVSIEASLINTIWEARLLRSFSGKESNVQDVISDLGLMHESKPDRVRGIASSFSSFHEVQRALSQLFVNTKSLEDLQTRTSILAGLKSPIALTVQSVGREYVRYFNQRWGRTGTLWDGRYKSYWIDKNPFLELNAQKYLDQLSKTSGLTNNEIEWSWATCAHYCGVFSGTNHIINKEKFRNFISPIPSYWEIGNTPFERQFKYREFLTEPQPQMVIKEIIRCMNRGLPWLKSGTKTPF